MKQFLLTLATAAMVACAANAQNLHFDKTSFQNAKNPIVSNLKLNEGGVRAFVTPNVNLNRSKHTSRVNDATTRVATDISYESERLETYNEIGLVNPLNYSDLTDEGFTGYGFASVFTSDMLERYVGNTITSLDFIVWDGVFTNARAFLLQASTGQIIWSADVDEVATLNGDEAYNRVACDYVITGEEGAIYAGWIADVTQSSTDQYASYVIMPYYPDRSESGLGAYILYKSSSGFGIYGNASTLEYSDGSVLNSAAYVVLETEGEAGLAQNDAEIANMNPVRASLNWSTNGATATIQNYGVKDITSVDWVYTVGDKIQSGSTRVDSIPFYGVGELNFAPVLSDTPSRTEATLTITSVNGVENATDMKFSTSAVTMGEQTYLRTPVIEEFTSNTCGWCPRGFIYMADAANEETIVPIAVHSDYSSEDPLQVDNYVEFLDVAAYSFPSAMINRLSTVSVDENLVANAIEMGNDRVEASIKLSTSTSGAGTLLDPKTITATSELTFGIDADEDEYSVIYVITEDGITGVTQLNYYGYYYSAYSSYGYSDAVIQNGMGWTNEEMEIAKLGYSYEPTYNHVAVAITDGLGDDESSALGAITNGQTLTHTAIMDMPSRIGSGASSVNEDNLTVAALLIDKASGEIVTAAQAKLGETSEASSIDQAKTTENAPVITLQDGAFNVVADNAVAQVYDLNGKLVTSATVNGSVSLPTFGKGVYTIRVVANGNVTTQKAAF